MSLRNQSRPETPPILIWLSAYARHVQLVKTAIIQRSSRFCCRDVTQSLETFILL